MKRLLVLVVTAAVVLFADLAWAEALPSVPAEEVGLASARLARIGEVLRREIEARKLPGAVVLVARKGKIAYFESFGAQDPTTGTPIARDAIFRAYSMTKPLVSVAVMMLLEDGRAVLTDPVSKFLPALAKLQVAVPKVDTVSGRVTYGLVPAEREMTLQDLLRHTSGLAYGEFTGNLAVKEAYVKAGLAAPAKIRDLTAAQEIERLAGVPLAHQPGTVWEYGLSTDVLGRVVEALAGIPLGHFLEERLFGPLGMADTGFSVPAGKLRRLAQPFPTDAATGSPIELYDVSAPPRNDSGGAGAVSTASDFSRFAQMLLNGGRLDGVRVLSRTTVRLMTADHLGKIADAGPTPGPLLLGTPGFGFGLGFAVRLEPGVAGTPGSVGEYTWAGYAGTYFWVDPREELVGILMRQAPGPSRVYYRKLFRQLVYQAIVD